MANEKIKFRIFLLFFFSIKKMKNYELDFFLHCRKFSEVSWEKKWLKKYRFTGEIKFQSCMGKTQAA